VWKKLYSPEVHRNLFFKDKKNLTSYKHSLRSNLRQNAKLHSIISKLDKVMLYAITPKIFTRESSYCFQRVFAIAILSDSLSVTRMDQSKTAQARITKSLLSAAWKTLVSGNVKLFHKFEGVTPNEGAK